MLTILLQKSSRNRIEFASIQHILDRQDMLLTELLTGDLCRDTLKLRRILSRPVGCARGRFKICSVP